MGFDQYHEPADGLSQDARTFVRTIASLIEAAEAISWYEQRISFDKNEEAKGIMVDAQGPSRLALIAFQQPVHSGS